MAARKKLWHSDDVVILELRSRKLAAWPDGIEGLARVEQVCADSNQLTTLTPALARLPRLRSLELTNNPIEELPDAVVAELAALRRLDLGDTPIRRLPEALASVRLDVMGLRNVPNLDWDQALSVLARIPTLTALIAGENAFGTLPPGLLGLTGLRRLYLPRCGLTELPDGVRALRDLHILSLQRNALRDLPDAIAELPALGSLVISGNPGIRKMKSRLAALGVRVQLS